MWLFRNKAVWLIMAILLIFVGMRYAGITDMLSFERLKTQSCDMALQLESHYALGVVLYCGVYALCIALSFPVMGPLSILGGFLFGFWFGLFYTVLSCLVGAMIAFSVFKTMTKRVHTSQLSGRIAGLKKQLDRYGHWYLLVLHFLVVVPFFVINMLAALANISYNRFIVVTAIGLLPAAAIYVLAGTELAQVNSLQGLLSGKFVIAMALLIALILIPLVVKRWRAEDAQ